jgi:tetratricopeptide (TPR) repeat protein
MPSAQRVTLSKNPLGIFTRAKSLAAISHSSYNRLTETHPMPELSANELFELALNRHEAGLLQEAEALYGQVLAGDPDDADVLQLLGVLNSQLGRSEKALELLHRALAINAQAPDCHFNLGRVLRDMNRHEEAIAAFRQAIALKPDYYEAYHLLGLSLRAMNRLDEAAEIFRKVLTLKPDFVDAWNSLGIVLRSGGKPDEAIVAYQSALALRPDVAEIHKNLAGAYQDEGDLQQAIRCLSKVIELQPSNCEALQFLGIAQRAAGDFEQAADAFEQLVTLRPDDIEAINNLGDARKSQGKLDEALAAFGRTVELRPDYFIGHHNVGTVLLLMQQPEKAAVSLRKAISLCPEFSFAQYNLAMALQECGDFSEAEKAYTKTLALDPTMVGPPFNYATLLQTMGRAEAAWEMFRKALAGANVLARHYPQKHWDGLDPTGKTILIHTDGRFGDTIFLARFVQLIRPRGAKIVLQCQAQLLSLLASLSPHQILPVGQTPPFFDSYILFGEIPLLLSIGVDDVPSAVPYISAPRDRIEAWATRIPFDKRLKVGLVWAGSDRGVRSHSLELFSPLASIPNVQFFSLQKGKESLQQPPAGMQLIDLTDDIRDFADTAALIHHLDLVISVDTSVVHVAGAIGKPVWVLIPKRNDYRWLLDREDSPWYPTMRLFRQTRDGDWKTPMQNIAEALQLRVTK